MEVKHSIEGRIRVETKQEIKRIEVGFFEKRKKNPPSSSFFFK